ncbi:MAG: RNA methyltransferase [Clostridia bacterium]|nr:RNA methyltransferase [Clostridia bacterium]
MQIINSPPAETTVILEGMTSISALLNTTCENDRRIQKIWVDGEKKKSKAPEIGFLTARSKEAGFSVEFVTAEQIDSYTTGNTHGGIIAFCSERHLPELTAEAILPKGFYVFLEGVEDPYNFGYTVRSLYAAGVDGIVLPPRNWMHAAGVVARASAGTSELIPMYTASSEDVIAYFRQKEYSILCAGIRDSVSIFEEHFPFPILLIVGGEKRGISRGLLEQADRIVRIDYGREFRGSLSAASAATVMAFELLRQNRSK